VGVFDDVDQLADADLRDRQAARVAARTQEEDGAVTIEGHMDPDPVARHGPDFGAEGAGGPFARDIHLDFLGVLHPRLSQRRGSHAPQRHNRLDPLLDIGVQQVVLGSPIDFFLDPRQRGLQRVAEAPAREKGVGRGHVG